MTLSGTTVSVTTSSPHQLIVGDYVVFNNINDSASNIFYNSTPPGVATFGFTVTTVPSTTTFKFTVPASSPTPIATASSYMLPPYPAQDLDLIDWNTYKQNGLVDDINGQVPQAVPSSYNQPANVVRMPDNSVILTPVPDRNYKVTYSGWIIPTALSLYSDTPTIPSQFEQIIVDKALHYAYMFRDNLEQAQVAEDRYTKNVNKMRRVLIPQTEYMRTDDGVY